MVTDAQIGIALEAFDQKSGYSKIEKMRAALEAALSAAEPVASVIAERDALIAAGLKCCDGTPNPDLRPFDLAMSFIDSTNTARKAADMLWQEYKSELDAIRAAPPAPSVAVKALVDHNRKMIPRWKEIAEDGPEGNEPLGAVIRALEKATAALSAQVQDVAGWQPIETAPHDTNVLLAWTDSTLPCGWKMEAGMASWGWRRDGVSNMSEHGHATHWMPLPAAPAKQEGGE